MRHTADPERERVERQEREACGPQDPLEGPHSGAASVRECARDLPRRGIKKKLLSLVLCCGLLVLFAGVEGRNIGASFSNDYDEGVYLCSARALNHGHPLFSSVFCSQPPLLIESIALVFRVFHESVWVGRAMVLCFALLALAAVAWIAWWVAGPVSAPFAMICLALPMSFFQTARSCTAEIPALALALLAIGCALSARGKWDLGWLATAGLCFAAAALFKLLVVPMLLPLLLLAGLSAAGPGGAAPVFQSPLPRLAKRVLALLVPGALVGAAVVARYNIAAVYDQAVRFHEASRAAYPLNLGGNWAALWHVALASCGVTITAIWGSNYLWRTQKAICLWLCAWALAAASFLATQTPLFNRHLILILPPFAIAAGASLRWAASFPGMRSLLAAAYLFSLPLISIDPARSELRCSALRCWRSLSTSSSKAEWEVVKLIQARTAPTDLVVTDEQMEAFRAGRSVPPDLCDTSFNRIDSGYLRDSEAIRAAAGARVVIFWTDRLKRLGRFHDWVRSHYRLISERGGREIYLRDDSG